MTPAEAQTIGLCWLARQPGLPEITALRQAVATLHVNGCHWCEWPLPELLSKLETWRPERFITDQWWSLPASARRRAIELAQDVEGAA